MAKLNTAMGLDEAGSSSDFGNDAAEIQSDKGSWGDDSDEKPKQAA